MQGGFPIIPVQGMSVCRRCFCYLYFFNPINTISQYGFNCIFNFFITCASAKIGKPHEGTGLQILLFIKITICRYISYNLKHLLQLAKIDCRGCFRLCYLLPILLIFFRQHSYLRRHRSHPCLIRSLSLQWISEHSPNSDLCCRRASETGP